MSKISMHQITCPSCGHLGEFTCWDSINVDLDPEMRNKAKNGSIFSWTCPHCGKSYIVPYATLYHDMKRKIMIYFSPTRPKGELGFSISTSKHHFRFDPEYTYRSTYEIEDYMEKINELESGLDDRVIELIKLLITRKNRPKDLPEGANLRFIMTRPGGEEEPTSLLFKCIAEKGIIPKEAEVMVVRFDIYKELEKEPLIRTLFAQEAEFPEISQAFLDGY